MVLWTAAAAAAAARRYLCSLGTRHHHVHIFPNAFRYKRGSFTSFTSSIERLSSARKSDIDDTSALALFDDCFWRTSSIRFRGGGGVLDDARGRPRDDDDDQMVIPRKIPRLKRHRIVDDDKEDDVETTEQRRQRIKTRKRSGGGGRDDDNGINNEETKKNEYERLKTRFIDANIADMGHADGKQFDKSFKLASKKIRRRNRRRVRRGGTKSFHRQRDEDGDEGERRGRGDFELFDEEEKEGEKSWIEEEEGGGQWSRRNERLLVGKQRLRVPG